MLILKKSITHNRNCFILVENIHSKNHNEYALSQEQFNDLLENDVIQITYISELKEVLDIKVLKRKMP